MVSSPLKSISHDDYSRDMENYGKIKHLTIHQPAYSSIPTRVWNKSKEKFGAALSAAGSHHFRPHKRNLQRRGLAKKMMEDVRKKQFRTYIKSSSLSGWPLFKPSIFGVPLLMETPIFDTYTTGLWSWPPQVACRVKNLGTPPSPFNWPQMEMLPYINHGKSVAKLMANSGQ